MMRFYFTILMSLRALHRNKMRSTLTALGMIIGVGAVIAMVSIGNGAKSQVESAISSLGDNLIIISPGSTTTGGVRGGGGSGVTLTVEDAQAIYTDLVEGNGRVVGVSPYLSGSRYQLLANGLNWNSSVVGVSPDWTEIRSWPVVEGSFFGEDDIQKFAKVAVVGKTVVDNLFPDESPIGQSVRLGNVPFRIIGVLDTKGYSNNNDQDDIVYIPYTAHMKRLSRRTFLSAIYVKARNPDLVETVKTDLAALLTERHGEEDFTAQDQQEIAAARTQATDTMTTLLGAIAGVSLLVGGIGIMNIMLVSVTERTREIGIRLALGAHGKDVLTQFLIEAILLSSLGGILGVTVGVVGSQVAGNYAGWAVEPSTTAAVVAVVFSSLVGVFFGFYPARKAAQMDPIEALRFE